MRLQSWNLQLAISKHPEDVPCLKVLYAIKLKVAKKTCRVAAPPRLPLPQLLSTARTNYLCRSAASRLIPSTILQCQPCGRVQAFKDIVTSTTEAPYLYSLCMIHQSALALRLRPGAEASKASLLPNVGYHFQGILGSLRTDIYNYMDSDFYTQEL